MWKGLEALFAVLFYLFFAVFCIYAIYVGIEGLFGSKMGAFIVIIATGWLIAATIVAVKKGLKEPLDKDKSSESSVKDKQDSLSE